MTPASSQAILDPDNDEPDIHRDDYHYRSIRDFQGKQCDPEPLFGIPREKTPSGSSSKDYLHAVPDPSRYRDPKRKLYLSPGPNARPVSYSFEKPDLLQKTAPSP